MRTAIARAVRSGWTRTLPAAATSVLAAAIWLLAAGLARPAACGTGATANCWPDFESFAAVAWMGAGASEHFDRNGRAAFGRGQASIRLGDLLGSMLGSVFGGRWSALVAALALRSACCRARSASRLRLWADSNSSGEGGSFGVMGNPSKRPRTALRQGDATITVPSGRSAAYSGRYAICVKTDRSRTEKSAGDDGMSGGVGIIQ